MAPKRCKDSADREVTVVGVQLRNFRTAAVMVSRRGVDRTVYCLLLRLHRTGRWLAAFARQSVRVSGIAARLTVCRFQSQSHSISKTVEPFSGDIQSLRRILMQIQVNTDRNIEATENFVGKIEEALKDRLRRFESRITRVEVHLSDENSAAKTFGADKKCVLEARLNGRQPIAVTALESDELVALRSAATKLLSALESALGKLDAGGRRVSAE